MVFLPEMSEKCGQITDPNHFYIYIYVYIYIYIYIYMYIYIYIDILVYP
mgnify:CR=1 FL=1